MSAIRETHRLFLCARCRRQVRICSRCDRGQIYCSRECSQSSRRESIWEAGRRYQQSSRGAEKHAERQRRYRMRLQQKQKEVTHHGSGARGRVPNEQGKDAVLTTVKMTLSVVEEQSAHRVIKRRATMHEFFRSSQSSLRAAFEATLLRAFSCTEDHLEYRCDFCARSCGVLSRLSFQQRR